MLIEVLDAAQLNPTALASMAHFLQALFAISVVAQAYQDESMDPMALADIVPEEFDCPMRQLALEFAMEIQPFLAADKLQEIADALNGAEEAKNSSCVTVPDDWTITKTKPPSWDDVTNLDSVPSIFVDFHHGDDTNDGSIRFPFKHLDTAIAFARKKYGSNFKRIILREGRHYLRKTLEIGPKDNNLMITNFNGELVELSGATLLDCDWKKTPVNGLENVYSCDVSEYAIPEITGLRINGKRAIRARYPNGDPETCGFCSDINPSSGIEWHAPKCMDQPVVEYYPEEPLRNTTDDDWFQRYQLGVGGCCDVFTPNAGYWCGDHTMGGGAFTYKS